MPGTSCLFKLGCISWMDIHWPPFPPHAYACPSHRTRSKGKREFRSIVYEILTNIGDDSAQDDLGLVGCDNGFPELRVIPRIDFAVPLDERRFGVPVEKLVRQGPVRS